MNHYSIPRQLTVLAAFPRQSAPCRLPQLGMGLEDEAIGASVHQDESRKSTDESVIAGGLRITINPPRSSFV